MSAPRVRVFVAAAGQELVNDLYRAILNDSRIVAAGAVATMDALPTTLPYANPDVIILDADLLTGLGNPNRMIEYVGKLPGAVVLLLPANLDALRGQFVALANVHEVLTKPASPSEVAARAYQVGLSAQIAASAQVARAVPSAAVNGAATPGAPTPGLTIAVFGKGGTGKTTVSAGLATVLHRHGIRTLLVGLDVPDAVGIQMGLSPTPNMLEWFRNPTPEVLERCVRRKAQDMPDVLLSPNDAMAAAAIANADFLERLRTIVRESASSLPTISPATAADLAADGAQQAMAAGGTGRIVALVDAIRQLPRPYAAVVLDLPPTLANDWAVQPMRRVNAVLLVAEPSYTDQVNVAHAVQVLTGSVDSRYRLSRSAVYIVLNRVQPGDLDGRAMQEGIAALNEQTIGESWTPPILAAIPASPAIRKAQTEFRSPVDADPDFRAAMESIAHYFFGDAIATDRRAPRKHVRFGPLKVAVR